MGENTGEGDKYLEDILKGRLEYLASSPSIDLAELKEGDVVWWTTKSGGRYYMKIAVPYERKGAFIKSDTGRGTIKGVSSDGRNFEIDNGGIHGSSLGSLIRIGHVIKEASVEFIEFSKKSNENGKTIRTSPVASMGVIRTEQYRKP